MTSSTYNVFNVFFKRSFYMQEKIWFCTKYHPSNKRPQEGDFCVAFKIMKRKAEEQDASEGEGARTSREVESNQDVTPIHNDRGPLGVLCREMLIHQRICWLVDVDIIWDEIMWHPSLMMFDIGNINEYHEINVNAFSSCLCHKDSQPHLLSWPTQLRAFFCFVMWATI